MQDDLLPGLCESISSNIQRNQGSITALLYARPIQ